MPRINEYPETQQLASTDLLLIDQGGGVYKSIEAGVMIDKIQSQAVGLLYNRCVLYGVTPEAKTPSAVDAAMEECCENSYTEGREQGRKDVGVANMVSLAGSTASGNRVTISVDPGYYYMIGTSNGTGSAISTNTLDVISGATKIFCAYISRSSSLSAMGLVKATDSSIVFQVPTNSAYLIYKLGPCE